MCLCNCHQRFSSIIVSIPALIPRKLPASKPHIFIKHLLYLMIALYSPGCWVFSAQSECFRDSKWVKHYTGPNVPGLSTPIRGQRKRKGRPQTVASSTPRMPPSCPRWLDPLNPYFSMQVEETLDKKRKKMTSVKRGQPSMRV